MKKYLFLFFIMNSLYNFAGIMIEPFILLIGQRDIQNRQQNAAQRTNILQDGQNKKTNEHKVSLKQNRALKNNQFGNAYRNR